MPQLECPNCHKYNVVDEHSFTDAATGKPLNPNWMLSVLACVAIGFVLAFLSGFIFHFSRSNLLPFFAVWLSVSFVSYFALERQRFFSPRVLHVQHYCADCGYRWS